MRIRHLHYFLVVAEELSFAKAAAKVHIEASPLSRAIKELEAELGARLFQRTNGRIRLTWAGEVFREEARRMLTFMEGARTRVHAAARGYRGRLRIGLTDRLIQPQFTQLLACCREEEPLTEVKIIEMTAKEMTNALRNDQIDAAFTVYIEPSDEFVNEIVWADRAVIAIPKNHPLLSFEKISPHEIARHALILYHPELCPSVYDVIRSRFCEFALPLPAIAEYASGHESMMMLVAAGYGIGLGLESQMTLYHHPGIIIRPLTDEVPSATTFITMLDKPPSEELSRFINRALRVGEAVNA